MFIRVWPLHPSRLLPQWDSGSAVGSVDQEWRRGDEYRKFESFPVSDELSSAALDANERWNDIQSNSELRTAVI